MKTAKQKRAEEKRRRRIAEQLEWPGGELGGWKIVCPNGHATVRSFTHVKKKLGAIAVSWHCDTCGETFGKRVACLHCAKIEGHHDWCPTGRNIDDFERAQLELEDT